MDDLEVVGDSNVILEKSEGAHVLRNLMTGESCDLPLGRGPWEFTLDDDTGMGAVLDKEDVASDLTVDHDAYQEFEEDENEGEPLAEDELPEYPTQANADGLADCARRYQEGRIWPRWNSDRRRDDHHTESIDDDKGLRLRRK